MVSREDLEVKALEAPISVPVGSEVLGRMFNVLGQPIDEKPAPKTDKTAPLFTKQPLPMMNSPLKQKFLKQVSRSSISSLLCSRVVK
jgi:F0F1-type ATP synthase beta subunit